MSFPYLFHENVGVWRVPPVSLQWTYLHRRLLQNRIRLTCSFMIFVLASFFSFPDLNRLPSSFLLQSSPSSSWLSSTLSLFHPPSTCGLSGPPIIRKEHFQRKASSLPMGWDCRCFFFCNALVSLCVCVRVFILQVLVLTVPSKGLTFSVWLGTNSINWTNCPPWEVCLAQVLLSPFWRPLGWHWWFPFFVACCSVETATCLWPAPGASARSRQFGQLQCQQAEERIYWNRTALVWANEPKLEKACVAVFFKGRWHVACHVTGERLTNRTYHKSASTVAYAESRCQHIP